MKKIVHENERDAINYACTLTGVKVTFEPTATEGILEATVTNKGRDISSELAWTLSEIACRKRYDDFEKKFMSEIDRLPVTDELP
jgi:hypothetical protein